MPLHLRVLRGTHALEEHEAALTELCSNPDLISTEADQCLLDFIQGGYSAAILEEETDATPPPDCAVENEEECLLLLDDLHSLWASDLVPSTTAASASSTSSGALPTTRTETLPPAAVKPWSARSSPSGTFVRDPATGRMKNLNEGGA